MSVHTIHHPQLGQIRVTERQGSRKLSARWVNGRLRVNIPAGVSRQDIDLAIERHMADFETIRPKARYHIGYTLDCHGDFLIAIAAAPASQTTISILLAKDRTPTCPKFVITIPQGMDTAPDDVQQRLSTTIHLAARRLAPAILLVRARELAAKLGLRVDKWEVAHGRNTLGTCYPSQRRIRLSYMCIFLTPELRDYIICHELAHLSCPGHDASFHRLCDSYCSGREATLAKQLRNFRWPVDR